MDRPYSMYAEASVQIAPDAFAEHFVHVVDTDSELDTFDEHDAVLQGWLDESAEEHHHRPHSDSTDSYDNVSVESADNAINAASGRTSQGRYLCLGDRQRIRELINDHHYAKSEVAKQFNISLNSVKYILSSKCTVNDNTRALNGMDPSTTRSSLADKKRTALDTHLTNWIKAEKEHAVITRASIERQAQIYMKEIHDCDFNPGRKWFQNFRKRCGISIQDIKRSMKQRKLNESLSRATSAEETVTAKGVDLSSSSTSSVEEEAFVGFNVLPEFYQHPSLGLNFHNHLNSALLQNLSFYDPSFYFPHQGMTMPLFPNHPISLMNLENFHQS